MLAAGLVQSCTPHETKESRLRDLVSKSKRSTVSISLTYEDTTGTLGPAGVESNPQFNGSGVVVGLHRVLTCRHVLNPPNLKPGLRVKGYRVMTDTDWEEGRANYHHAEAHQGEQGPDLAVLDVPDLESEGLDVETSDDIEPIIVIGHPRFDGAPRPTVGQGIVSAKEDRDGMHVLRLDAHIYDGNSGGAVISATNGRILGIAYAGAIPVVDQSASPEEKKALDPLAQKSTIGIAFAIAPSTIREFLQSFPAADESRRAP